MSITKSSMMHTLRNPGAAHSDTLLAACAAAAREIEQLRGEIVHLKLRNANLEEQRDAHAARAAAPIARPISDRRCDSNLVDHDGSCIACDAAQGEACQAPDSRKNSQTKRPPRRKRLNGFDNPANE